MRATGAEVLAVRTKAPRTLTLHGPSVRVDLGWKFSWLHTPVIQPLVALSQCAFQVLAEREYLLGVRRTTWDKPSV